MVFDNKANYEIEKSSGGSYLFPNNVLNFLFGSLFHQQVYTLDKCKWSQAIKELKELYDKEYPELFKGFTFDLKDNVIHSKDVGFALWCGKNTRLYSIGDDVMRFNPEVQRKYLEQSKSRISEKYYLVLEKITRKLEELVTYSC